MELILSPLLLRIFLYTFFETPCVIIYIFLLLAKVKHKKTKNKLTTQH